MMVMVPFLGVHVRTVTMGIVREADEVAVRLAQSAGARPGLLRLPETQQMTAQPVGSLSASWETQPKIPAPRQPSSRRGRNLGKEPADWNSVYLRF